MAAAMLVEGAGAGGSITEAVTSIMGVVSTVITTVTNNPILLVFFASGVVGIAIGIVRGLKHAQKAINPRGQGAKAPGSLFFSEVNNMKKIKIKKCMTSFLMLAVMVVSIIGVMPRTTAYADNGVKRFL